MIMIDLFEDCLLFHAVMYSGRTIQMQDDGVVKDL